MLRKKKRVSYLLFRTVEEKDAVSMKILLAINCRRTENMMHEITTNQLNWNIFQSLAFPKLLAVFIFDKPTQNTSSIKSFVGKFSRIKLGFLLCSQCSQERQKS